MTAINLIEPSSRFQASCGAKNNKKRKTLLKTSKVLDSPGKACRGIKSMGYSSWNPKADTVKVDSNYWLGRVNPLFYLHLLRVTNFLRVGRYS